MTFAYFDCFSGISGNMTLGALCGLGVSVDWLKKQIHRLPLSGFDIVRKDVMRSGIQAVQVDVIAEQTHHHRHFAHIRDLIGKSPLPQTVKTKSLAVFQRIAEAEAKIHGCSIDDVHFHEVGGIDAIVDIVGACLGLNYLGITQVVASALPLGSGLVRCQHGVLPVPAPATIEILKGIPVYAGSRKAELVTPTGAALMASLSGSFEPLPAMRMKRCAYGAGTHEFEDHPNLLRIIVGEKFPTAIPNTGLDEKLVMLETCIDDMNPEVYGYLMERLFADGVLDVFWSPIYMKKNRPGILIQVLCAPEKKDAAVRRILSETILIGVRYYTVGRISLPRRSVEVNTRFGRLTAKQVTGIDGTVRVVPEYEVCRKIAAQHEVALRSVYEAVVRAAGDPEGSFSVNQQHLDKR
jgi:hypothetical protein